MADFWQPTAEGFFARVSKAVTLEAVKEACGSDGLVEISGMKKGEMCKRAETLWLASGGCLRCCWPNERGGLANSRPQII